MGADATQRPSPSDEPARYRLGAVVLHWVSALFVVIVGILGLLDDSWSKQTQGLWLNMHAVLGLLGWVLNIARLAWRFRHPAPLGPDDAGQLSRRLSGPVHAALYVLMLVIPILGIITFIWHARVFDFGLFPVGFGGVFTLRIILSPPTHTC